ncbi:MAG TPA: CHASE3 domain-containing protein, partial [Gaiellaceae bacterium]|nr:CHASE3 domain-containing protein [Gaiellaceae bacterium]
MPERVAAITPERIASVRRRTVVADAVLLGLIVILTGVAAYAATRLYTTAEDRYIKEAFPIRAAVRDTLVQMLNEETGVRGYVISGKQSSLTPYELGQQTVAADLDHLDRLTTRRPEIRPDVLAARRLVTQLNAFYLRQVNLVGLGPAGRRQARQNIFAGQTLFDEFRRVIGRLQASSRAIVADARETQRRTYWTTLAVALGAGAIAIALTIWLLLTVPSRIWSLYDVERELRKSAERGDRASRSLQHVDDAVILVDADDAIRYWNPAAARYLAVAEDEAIGRTVTDLVPELAAGGTGTAIARDGVERFFVVRETRFPEGRVLVLQDVTGERELERTRSEFVATASHELRTPLAAVYGAVRTLRRPDLRHDPELEAQLLGIIESESDRLKDIIERILMSAEIDRGALTLHAEHCDVRELAASTIDAARLHAPDGVELRLDAPDEVTVTADAGKLRQVVVNLLDNAIKYSPDGGTITLTVAARP